MAHPFLIIGKAASKFER